MLPKTHREQTKAGITELVRASNEVWRSVTKPQTEMYNVHIERFYFVLIVCGFCANLMNLGMSQENHINNNKVN